MSVSAALARVWAAVQEQEVKGGPASPGGISRRYHRGVSPGSIPAVISRRLVVNVGDEGTKRIEDADSARLVLHLGVILGEHLDRAERGERRRRARRFGG